VSEFLKYPAAAVGVSERAGAITKAVLTVPRNSQP